MGVINATQAKGGTVVATGLVGRFVGWVEGLFGHAPTPTAPAAHGEGDAQTGESNLMEFGREWDKTGGWDRRKKSGWSPHGDEGMR